MTFAKARAASLYDRLTPGLSPQPHSLDPTDSESSVSSAELHDASNWAQSAGSSSRVIRPSSELFKPNDSLLKYLAAFKARTSEASARDSSGDHGAACEA